MMIIQRSVIASANATVTAELYDTNNTKCGMG